MKARETASSNRVFALAGGTRENDLHVRESVEAGRSTLSSVWVPTDDERAAIAAGDNIELTVWGEGTPPVAMRVTPERPLDTAGYDHYDSEAIHLWFSLTYANYLVLPRAVLQSMPNWWQKRFVLLQDEMSEAFGHLDWPDYYVRALTRPTEWTTPVDKCDDCTDGKAPDGQLCTYCGGEQEVEGEPRYETPDEVGFRDDPIPHYERGRTRIAPAEAAS